MSRVARPGRGRIASCTGLLLLAAPALAAEGSPEAAPGPAAPAGVRAVADCIAEHAPRSTMRQRIEMRTTDRVGDERTLDVEGQWKRDARGSKMVLRVSAPADLRGTAFLLIEREDRPDDLFSFLPEIGKSRRISGRSVAGSLFGTDFTYEDVERLQTLASSADTARLDDGEAASRPAFVLESRPAPDAHSQYTRIVSWIDRERCVPLRVDFYRGGDEPAKVLQVPPEKVAREGAAWIAREMTMQDLENETRSRILVQDVEVDVDLSDALFSPSALERRR